MTLWCIFRYDCRIIITQSPYEGVAAAIAKQIAGWCGKKIAVIIESHGDFEANLFLQRRIVFTKSLYWLMQRLARFTLNRADALRAISNSTRAQLSAWRPDCVIVQFIAWTDIDAFLQAKENFRKSVRPVVLYAGVLISGKGVHHLLNAFAALMPEFPEAQLLIIGRNQDPEYARQLGEIVQQQGMTSQVKFLMEMPQQQLAQYMAQAHVMVLPSLSEGLGRVVVEAMAAGTPVIGSRIGGIPDLIQDSVSGFLVSPGDETALAEKIRWILKYPQKSQEMGQQAHRASQSIFSTEIWLSGYRQVVKTAQSFLVGEHAQ